jgi:hypothetical protein
MQPIYDAFGVNPSPQPMSDVDDLKELLTLAARAMGDAVMIEAYSGAYYKRDKFNLIDEWDPLTPGDGAEMEDKLRISVTWQDDRVCSNNWQIKMQAECYADHADEGTARRWASLRVAAAIGRSMK